MAAGAQGDHIYALALGSNQCRAGRRPRAVLLAALAALDRPPLRLIAASRLRETPPLGPSRRRFVNAAALVATPLSPPALLASLKAMERRFGRRPGRRWGARPLDIDIILWSGGRWRGAALAIPHKAFRMRDFVLDPLADIAPGWRDPQSGRTVRQLKWRNGARKPVDQTAKAL